MSNRTDRELLSDIREAIHRIVTYVTGMAYESFAADTKTQDAVIRNLEILGEAAKNLSEQLRSEHPGVPWKSMAGARIMLLLNVTDKAQLEFRVHASACPMRFRVCSTPPKLRFVVESAMLFSTNLHI